MFKNLKYILLVFAFYLIMPSYIFAESDAVEEGQSSQINTDTKYNCESKGTTICQSDYVAGVRFTFIYQDGSVASDSYDFTTRTSGPTRNMNYNVNKGDKSKLSGSVNLQETDIFNLKKLSDLTARVNYYITSVPEYQSGRVAFINTTGETGGKKGNAFVSERKWFSSLTQNGLPRDTYTANINAFIAALHDIYPSFNAVDMKMKLQQGCEEGKEIFIQMEPIYTVYHNPDGTKRYVFGTVRDIVTYFSNINQTSRIINFINKKGHLSAIYYDSRINAPRFNGFEPFNPSTFKLQSINDLNAKIGYAVALDWANSPEGYCNKCVYNSATGIMTYEDQRIAGPILGAREAHFALASTSEGGKNCCDSLRNDYQKGMLNASWKAAYEQYCNKLSCSIVNNKYYCLNGNQCNKTQYDIECDESQQRSCSIINNKYYCKDGNQCNKTQYDKECDKPQKYICSIVNNKYYCLNGNQCNKTQYDIECDESQQCCEDEPINPGDIQGAVANCCVETTHSYAKDYDLDQLFCYHNDLKVDKFWAKCNADYYKSDDFELNEYCDMYCTERVTIDVPEAITATSGRYFTLSKNPVGNTTSPYIEGYKRCRITVKYDDWERDYIQVVREQVKIYNEYQKQMSYVESYNQLIKEGNPNQTSTATVKCSATATAGDCKEVTTTTTPTTTNKKTTSTTTSTTAKPQYTGGGTGTSNLPDETCTITYTKHYVNSSQLKSYYSAYIPGDNGGETINNHGSIQIALGGSNRAATFNSNMPSDYVITGADKSACQAIVNKNQANTYTYKNPTSGCSSSAVNYTCTIEWAEASHEYNIDADKAPYQQKADQLSQQLQASINNAKTLESKLSQCNNFFNNTKKESVYKFDPSISFRYSQIYRNDNGKSVLDETSIPFMSTPGCTISNPETGDINYDGGMDTSSPHYSAIYGEGTISVTDFSSVKFVQNRNDFNSILDTAYQADKRFTHDARYKAVCEWEEEPNNVNTLVPNGAVTETAGANFTIHEREYKIYLTTFDGTYETDWSVTNVGEKGKFDNFLQNEGTNTCSGNTPNSEDTFSCTLHIEYEIVYTGKCNGITKNPDDCDPVSNLEGFFQFKVADPTNLFPTGTIASDGKPYAKNWTDTSKGLTAKEEIEEAGSRGNTYDESRVTYKFHLKPADMRHIKNYNVTRNANQLGGYSDFNMVCDCPSQAQTNTAVSGGVACTKCKSKLLDDLEDGRIRYDGQTHQVSVWTASKSIDQVRNETWR